jgi:PAS domain S-box-containing protein
MGGSASVHDSSHGAIGIQETYHMLKNESGLRDAFINFLASEYRENLTFLSTPFDFTIEYEKSLKEKAHHLLSNVFASPETPSVHVKSALHASLESQNLDSLQLVDINFLKLIHENRKQILTLVIVGAFPAFLKSEAYQRWFWTRESPSIMNTPIQTIFSQFRANDFDSILTKQSWLQTICHSFDNLPISISIADANQRRFPLIYVNSAFQEMSGFSLQDVIGKSNKFLQKGLVEESMGNLMSQRLGAGETCRVFISNKRKDDTPYRSLLSMKPIYSLDGVYRLVIGMQFDVTNQFNSYIALCIANDIFQALPSTCPNDVVGEAKNALSPEF